MIPAGRRLELLLLAWLPGIITCLMAVFYLAAKHIGGLNHFMPALPLIPMFYWGMMHAREMPYWFVFVLGLVMDSVTGLPPGLSSLLNVLFLALLHSQRKYAHKEGFVVKWCYFAALLAVIGALQWILLSFYYSHAESIGPAVLQWLLTVLIYPPLHHPFDILNDRMHSRRWQILHGA